MSKESTQLSTVQFRKHKVAYNIAAIIALVLGVMFYFVLRSESETISWLLLCSGIIIASYCFFNAISDAVVLELSPKGIKYKKSCYKWDELRSYSIREENEDDASFTYLVLNLKNTDIPIEIQLDWIDDQESVKHHMADFAKAFQIEFKISK